MKQRRNNSKLPTIFHRYRFGVTTSVPRNCSGPRRRKIRKIENIALRIQAARPHRRIIRRENKRSEMERKERVVRFLTSWSSERQILRPSATVRIEWFERNETKWNEGTAGLKRGAWKMPRDRESTRHTHTHTHTHIHTPGGKYASPDRKLRLVPWRASGMEAAAFSCSRTSTVEASPRRVFVTASDRRFSRNAPTLPRIQTELNSSTWSWSTIENFDSSKISPPRRDEQTPIKGWGWILMSEAEWSKRWLRMCTIPFAPFYLCIEEFGE